MNTLKHGRTKVAHTSNGHRHHEATATPVALGALYARIDELEERIRRLEERSIGETEKKNGKKPACKNGKNGHDAQHMAVVVISSVVASLIDQPHRIVSVNPLYSQSSHSACPWALQGRMMLHEARS